MGGEEKERERGGQRKEGQVERSLLSNRVSVGLLHCCAASVIIIIVNPNSRSGLRL